MKDTKLHLARAYTVIANEWGLSPEGVRGFLSYFNEDMKDKPCCYLDYTYQDHYDYVNLKYNDEGDYDPIYD